MLRRNRGIFSLRRLAERRCWRPETSETGTQQTARYLELCTEDTGEQSTVEDAARTRSAVGLGHRRTVMFPSAKLREACCGGG